MKNSLLIARHEFLTNVKRRGFLFTAFVLPLIIIAVQIVMIQFTAEQEAKTGSLGRVGYVDEAGLLEQAKKRPPEYVPYPDQETAHAALMEGEIGGYFLLPADYILRGEIHGYTTKNIPLGIQEQMQDFAQDNLLADLPPERVERLKNPLNLTMSTLQGDKQVDQESAMVTIFTPIIFAMIFMMSIFTTSGFLMQGVVDEKENRLIEILMTSVTPLEMLWGKIVGLGALGLVQVAFWLAAGGVVLTVGTQVWEVLEKVQISISMIILGPLYLVLGYLLFGSILSGIGASSTSMQEAQSISSLVSMLAVVPMFAFTSVLSNPNGSLPVILSLIPFTAPMTVMMRLPLADVPLWQIGLSLLLLVAAVGLVIWLAAQVFRVGLLMYGKRLGPRELITAIREGIDIVPRKD